MVGTHTLTSTAYRQIQRTTSIAASLKVQSKKSTSMKGVSDGKKARIRHRVIYAAWHKARTSEGRFQILDKGRSGLDSWDGQGKRSKRDGAINIYTSSD